MDIAIVGCGGMGTGYAQRLELLRATHDIGTIYSHDLPDGKRIPTEKAQTVFVDSLDTILGDANIGAVIISASTYAHDELATKCIAAGKAILVEKPMTSGPSEATKLVQLANKHNVVLMTSHQLPLNKQFAAMLDMISANHDWRVTKVESYRHYPVVADAAFEKLPPLVTDEGPHALSLVLEVLRRSHLLSRGVRIETASRRVTRDQDEVGFSLSDFQTRGILAEVVMTKEKPINAEKRPKNRGIEIYMDTPDGEAVATWDEDKGEIRIDGGEYAPELQALKGIPAEGDALLILTDTFLKAAKSPKFRPPAFLRGEYAATVIALLAGVEEKIRNPSAQVFFTGIAKSLEAGVCRA